MKEKKGNIVSTILISKIVKSCLKKKKEGLTKEQFIELYKQTYEGEITEPLMREINKVYESGSFHAYQRLNQFRLNQYHVKNYHGKYRIKTALKHDWHNSFINKKHPEK